MEILKHVRIGTLDKEFGVVAPSHECLQKHGPAFVALVRKYNLHVKLVQVLAGGGDKIAIWEY